MSPEGATSFGLKDLDWIFGVWLLLLVILWNFGYPGASPILDVSAALILFFVSSYLRT